MDWQTLLGLSGSDPATATIIWRASLAAGQPLDFACLLTMTNDGPPGEVESAASQQGLTAQSQRHEACCHRFGQALDLEGFGAAGHILG